MRFTTNPPIRPTERCDRSPPDLTNGLPAGRTNTDRRIRHRRRSSVVRCTPQGVLSTQVQQAYFHDRQLRAAPSRVDVVDPRVSLPAQPPSHTPAGESTKESRTWQTHGDFPARTPTGGTGSCSAPVAAWPVRSSSTRKVSAARQGPGGKERRKPSAWTAPSSRTAGPMRWPSTSPMESGAGCRSRSGHPC
jgi:hypothetical protein